MPNVYKAIVRSTTTWLIGMVIGLAAHFGYHLSLVVAAQITATAGLALTVGVHLLEVKWPAFGVLLGWLGAPAYQKVVTNKQLIAQLQAELASLTATATFYPSPAPGTPVDLSPAPGTPIVDVPISTTPSVEPVTTSTAPVA